MGPLSWSPVVLSRYAVLRGPFDYRLPHVRRGFLTLCALGALCWEAASCELGSRWANERERMRANLGERGTRGEGTGGGLLCLLCCSQLRGNE